FICEHAVAGFLVSVGLSGGRQNRGCWLTEEAHQSLVLPATAAREHCSRTHRSLRNRKTAKSDLILQFREQGFRVLPLPLWVGKLLVVNQLARAVSGGFVL